MHLATDILQKQRVSYKSIFQNQEIAQALLRPFADLKTPNQINENISIQHI